MIPDKHNYNWLPITLLLLFIVLYYTLSHEGIYYADDLSYSHYASLLAENAFDLNTLLGHTFIHRPTVYGPTAILYAFFGINKITYTLWPLWCTLATVLLVNYGMPLRIKEERWYAILFLGLNFYFLFFSNILYPDNIVAFFSFSATLIVFHARHSTTYLNLKGFATALFLLLAFMAKETAAFYLPFLVMVTCFDLLKKKDKRIQFWFATWFSVILLGILYLTYYYISTGNAFQRFLDIEEANYVYDNYLTAPNRSYLKRLLWEPISVMTSTGTFIPFVFLFGSGNEVSEAQHETRRYWMVLFLSGLASLWSASTSYTGYNPISLDGRMFNLLIPPLAIAAAIGLPAKIQLARYTLLYLLLFTAAALYLHDKSAIPYILLAGFFLIQFFYLVYLNKSVHRIVIVVFAVCFLIRPLYFIIKPQVLHYEAHQQVISYLDKHTGQNEVLLLSPGYLKKAATYYSHFIQNKHIIFAYYTSYASLKNTPANAEVYLIVNERINTQTPFTEQISTDMINKLFKNKHQVFRQGPLILYKLDAAVIAN